MQSKVIIMPNYGVLSRRIAIEKKSPEVPPGTEHIPDEECFMRVSFKWPIVGCECQIVISCFIVFEGLTIDISLKCNRKLL